MASFVNRQSTGKGKSFRPLAILHAGMAVKPLKTMTGLSKDAAQFAPRVAMRKKFQEGRKDASATK
jgi:hypothetical protein